jgi:hypothetical protein
MAYCPRCGREQRCGCSECHTCGVPLVESTHPSALPARTSEPIVPEPRRQAIDQTPEYPAAELMRREARTPNWLGHVFLILGLGVVLICVVEMINSIMHFPTLRPLATAPEGVRRAGYYLGLLLYTNSARLLTGFALVSAGVLTSRMTEDGSGWDGAIRVTGLAMGAIGVVYALTAIILAIPFSQAPYALEVILPPLWASVPLLLIAGAALIGAGFLMASRLSRESVGFGIRPRRGRGSEAAGTDAARVKSYGTERGGGVAN